MSNKQLELRVDLNTINHLGLNLYSNIPAVLSELIANSWDADAKVVKVLTNSNTLEITDDGNGMTFEEIQSRFLTVGYERRKEIGDTSENMKRQVMGRKGIGKLSIFSIADSIVIHSKKNDSITSFELDTDEIKKNIENKSTYYPKIIQSHYEFEGHSGTAIVLSKLKKRLTNIELNLKKRISRRFDIWGTSNFEVYVNSEKVSIEDRGYYHLLEYVNIYGDFSKNRFNNVTDSKLIQRQNTLGISGWIGFVKESGMLSDDTNENLNKITIISRGKVSYENILDKYRDGGLYTKYLIGEIRADYLDDTNQEDIATSNRQGYIEDDERFERLKKFLKEELAHLSSQRVKFKEVEGEEDARNIPVISNWIDTLKGDDKKSARKMFATINKIDTDDPEHKKQLYKSGILAFETLRHRNKLNSINDSKPEQLEILFEVFNDLDDIESSWYYEITKSRLEIINKLIEIINEDSKEQIIQKFIYDHLWLLDPAWDKATSPENYMEQKVNTAFDKVSIRLTKEERNSRFDIRYRKTEGKHVIIELKKSSVTIKEGILGDQVRKYKDALTKVLQENGYNNFSIECICLLGKLPSGWNNETNIANGKNALAIHNIRVLTYSDLITNAQKMYSEYMEHHKEIGKISSILDEISNI